MIDFPSHKCTSSKGFVGCSLTKQPTIGDATAGFPAKWCLRNQHRNSVLITCEFFWGIQITEELWNRYAHQNVLWAIWNDIWACKCYLQLAWMASCKNDFLYTLGQGYFRGQVTWFRSPISSKKQTHSSRAAGGSSWSHSKPCCHKCCIPILAQMKRLLGIQRDEIFKQSGWLLFPQTE